MLGDTDNHEKNESRKIAILLILLIVVLVAAVIWLLPIFTEIISVDLSPGLGLKDAAVVSFFVSLVVMIIFAIAAGDGLLGEIQFIIGGFFTFFFIIWIMVAWIF